MKIPSFQSCGKRPRPTLLPGLHDSCCSQELSQHASARGLSPAPFPTWVGTPLFRQPGEPKLPRDHHIGAEDAADPRSTQPTAVQNSRAQAVPRSQPPGSLDYRRAPPRPARSSLALFLIFVCCEPSPGDSSVFETLGSQAGRWLPRKMRKKLLKNASSCPVVELVQKAPAGGIALVDFLERTHYIRSSLL